MSSRMPALRVPPALSKSIAWISPSEDARELPLVHRLAIIYLMLPVVIWLVGWFEWWFGIPAALLLVVAFWQSLCGSWRPTFSAAVVGVAAVAGCWVMLTQAGGVFDSESQDWLAHKTNFVDLARHPWPVFLQDPIRVYMPEEVYSFPLLRYYLGYFMTPGLVGHWLGPAVLNWAVPLWTWLGVALIMLMFTRERRGWGVAIAALIFVFFSGMDILRMILAGEWGGFGLRIEWDGLPRVTTERGHIEWGGLLGVYTQYSSNMTGLMWVPQHFIPAGLYTFLMLQLRGNRRFLAVSGVLLAAAPFWSVFFAIGLLPLIVVLLWENGIRPFLRWPNLLLAVPLVALIALYLTSGSLDFLRGWIWERYEWSLLVRWAPLFYLSEFLLLVGLLWVFRPDLRREPFFIACIVTLSLLPVYYIAHFNDLVSRASLPFLLLLCWYCTETILGRGSARTYARRGWKYFLGIACMVAILAIGSVTALVDLMRATEDVGRVRYEDWRYTTLVLPRLWQKENTAYDIPNMLRLLLDEDDIHPIYGRGELIAQSKFDVYLEEDHLVLVKYDCREDEAEQFFLYAIPADPDVLPAAKRALGLEYIEFLDIYVFRGAETQTSGGTCGVRLPLPQYAVAGFLVGQWTQDGGVDWQASYGFDAHFDSLTSGEPIIRSQFDVYLRENRLTYVKEPCVQADTERGFFLHVIPVDEADLPEDRREHGFDNLDFGFGTQGILIDGRCVAVRFRPDYDVVSIRTGQFAEDGEVWSDAYSFLSDIDTYRSLISGDLVIRSYFDVYLSENRLAYVREPCVQADTEHRFFLHVFPVDEADLPEDWREYGFDNLDFAFGTRGNLDGERCVAVRALPDYDIISIRTGQFTEEGEVWSAEYSFHSRE